MRENQHTNGKGSNGQAGASHSAEEAHEKFLIQLESAPDSVSGVGRSQEERRMIADRLFDSSMDCSDDMLAIGYALRAVRLDPANLDSRVFLALAAQGPRDELIEELEAIVAVGEADLGPAFFRENRGSFWGIMETRPYMRARTRLAIELHLHGRIAEAIRHYEEMLQLNPGDNQGLRYPLLGHYLENDDLASVRRLFTEYGDEWSAMFNWAKVLERYLSGDLPGAIKALQRARKQNPDVEQFITGRKRAPKARPDFYSPGEITEAMACMDVMGTAWTKHREAVRWLKKEHGTALLFPKVRGKSR